MHDMDALNDTHAATAAIRRARGLRRRIMAEQGLTTAEYAVGTVAAAGLGGVLIKLLTSDTVRNLIWELLRKAFETMTF